MKNIYKMFNKELEDLKNKWTEVNNTTTEINNRLDRISSRITEAEEQVSELEDRVMETTVREQRKKNEKNWRYPQRPLGQY